MKEICYPIKFKPILKEKIWGGNKLMTTLNKSSDLNNIGESWEVSDVEGDISVVINGALKNRSLKSLLEDYTHHLLGKKNFELFGKKFPLLIKFIDAKSDLSIQLHPNDDLASERHDSFGKTEMWYVMQADKDANLIVGFNQKMDSDTYLKHLKEKSLTEILNFDKVKSGDTYFIEAGRIHAIGAGVLLAEIQQTSDITYRVYDWDRVDDHGNERELHNDLAIDAFDFNMENDFRVVYKKEENTVNKMVSCPYFTTNFLHVTEPLLKLNNKDSFHIYMCVEGKALIETENASEFISKGETILLPAAVETYKISSSNAKLLEVYV
ncbi:type I phosphomannose isomerase catalytic subunit [Psychroserpens sp. XS_ASV72]|uniref:type I phosphomannose isomerase catalytic subunit n=1 Tax=Psychroserpens sp. XS_ASV72 TaxID=3241293 RepID=UPI003519007F